MTSYAERTGREPDFRIRYEKLDSPQRLFQHMRTDFTFESEDPDNPTWMIWPEFENEQHVPYPEDADIPVSGTATMWVLNGAPDYRALLRRWLAVGARGLIVTGRYRVANAEVIELLGDELASACEAKPANERNDEQ